MLSLGIDVGVRKGSHLVLMDDRFQVVERGRLTQPSEVACICSAKVPDIVAVDSPPAWGLTGNARQADRQLQKMNIQLFRVPSVSDKPRQKSLPQSRGPQKRNSALPAEFLKRLGQALGLKGPRQAGASEYRNRRVRVRSSSVAVLLRKPAFSSNVPTGFALDDQRAPESVHRGSSRWPWP
jgi:hypothetical protein